MPPPVDFASIADWAVEAASWSMAGHPSSTPPTTPRSIRATRGFKSAVDAVPPWTAACSVPAVVLRSMVEYCDGGEGGEAASQRYLPTMGDALTPRSGYLQSF